jgi:lipoprotein NlpD|tara:strand:+ start:359 stop:754 length:396 start_codon:yes stop_codon:yes gene_type:complete
MQPRKESASIKKWVWPGEGRVVTRFNLAQDENGINIAGIDGSPVRAAADGKIVYAGTGLRGYGLLLILKHNDTFLSAYAHNRAVMVSEGDQVNAGQVIAEMGQSGAESIQLHFEIRRNGQPVDPQRYLPKK